MILEFGLWQCLCSMLCCGDISLIEPLHKLRILRVSTHVQHNRFFWNRSRLLLPSHCCILFFTLFLPFFGPCLFRSPWSQFWQAMTMTVAYKSPSPWIVSAYSFWDETTAIRSSASLFPAIPVVVSCQIPPSPHTHIHTDSTFRVLHGHFKPSGLFSGKVQIKL